MKHYLYQLKLNPSINSDEAWTEADEKKVSEHFNYLKEHTATGTVLLAGRTNREYEDGFGIVIFKAEDWQAAEAFMKADPSIEAGVMSGQLFAYHIALESLSRAFTEDGER